MSILARPSRRPTKTQDRPATQVAPSRARMAKDAEAPDRGAMPAEREAPDTGRIRRAEAPDAGEGRGGFLDHEFTHGRSQS